MAPADQVLEVICDAGSLIHLDELDCLDLLADFAAVWVPEQVWREVDVHRPEALSNPAVEFRRVSDRTPAGALLRTVVRTLGLHRGEEAALCCMIDHPAALLLTDDAAARVAARSLGYRAHGTVGVLLRSIRTGRRLRTDVVRILRSVPEISSLHIRRDLLKEIIEQVDRGDGIG